MAANLQTAKVYLPHMVKDQSQMGMAGLASHEGGTWPCIMVRVNAGANGYIMNRSREKEVDGTPPQVT
jgi:hypothetical protein